MESLSGLWKKLSLSESEGRRFVVEESDGGKEFFLAAVLHRSDAKYGGDCKNFEGFMENQKGF